MDANLDFITGDGEMASLIRAYDWSATPLGTPDGWPPGLRTAIRLLLNSRHPMHIFWGPEATFFYNDGFVPSAGPERHPSALGRPAAESWGEIWPVIGAEVHKVRRGGGHTWYEDQHVPIMRRGVLEDAYWTYGFSPIDDDTAPGGIGGVISILTETTTRKALEAELRTANTTLEAQVEERSAALRLYRDIVQSDDAPVVAFDTDMRITAFNKAHAEAYARVYGIEQQIGDTLLEQFVPEQAAIVRQFMARALDGETFTVQEDFGDPSLDVPHWRISYNPLRDETGAIVGGFHHALDITVEYRAQRELEKAQEQLRQSQKLDAIGQLTGGVAHDFNNLLTVIRGSVDLLRRDNLSEAKRARYVDAIGDTADRAAKLTSQLLSFARRQALKSEVFDAGASLEEVADMVRTMTGSRIVLDIKVPEASFFIDADRSQFDTAIVNMGINARDAMGGEGRLTIATGPVSGIPALRGHEARVGDFVAFTIADTGGGMPADVLERIFEPFFTTKGVGHGTGLGLSQVIGFAKQSGGDIKVDSMPSEGSTFTLYLPRAYPDGREEGDTENAEQSDGDGICVLVVEDNEQVGEFATEALAELGYDSVLATDGNAALRLLESGCTRFHVIFSDVVMPGMGGIELGEKVRERYPDVPIILTSGYSHVLAQNGQHGFELLHKPYSVEQLSHVLRKAIAWQARKRTGHIS